MIQRAMPALARRGGFTQYDRQRWRSRKHMCSMLDSINRCDREMPGKPPLDWIGDRDHQSGPVESDAMTKILLIEDDNETAEEIAAELQQRGYETEWAASGIDGLAKARSCQSDAMIVDRMLPGMDGLSIIEALRKEQVRTPVLVLSALSGVDERVRGLKMGGDDYLTKPFEIIELVARIEALLRRPAETRETVLRVGLLELDLISRTATRGARAIDLLPREFRLLEYMMQRSDQLLTRAMLLGEVWNYKFVPATNLVDVHMGRLRHKVDGPGEPPMIHNVRGAGFILREDS
jgi:two-component system OmpR family response regulator